VFGGDNLHMNDGKNMTPGSGHILDTDGRFEKVVDVTIESTCSAIEYLLTRHAKLTVIVLAGNHDIEAHLILKSALKQRYRDIDRITFYADPREIKYLRHGNFLAFFHHGDKMKPEKLCMIAADQSKDWSMCKYRVAFTGHLHHLRMTDFPGVTHITLRAFAPADAYGANFGGIRGICAFTVDAEKGLKRVDYENMERD
jgi:DNA repair exonuclease SbcCD nuclease subunit